MKTFHTLVLGLFISFFHQISFGITEHDVLSFGENDEYIYPHSTDTTHDRLLIARAHQNRMRRIQDQETPLNQALPLNVFSEVVHKEVVAPQQDVSTSHAMLASTPDSVSNLYSCFNEFNNIK